LARKDDLSGKSQLAQNKGSNSREKSRARYVGGKTCNELAFHGKSGGD